MNKRCPSCNTDFECKADDIFNCQCTKVQLNAKNLHALHGKFRDCLCLNCLQNIEQVLALSNQNGEKNKTKDD